MIVEIADRFVQNWSAWNRPQKSKNDRVKDQYNGRYFVPVLLHFYARQRYGNKSIESTMQMALILVNISKKSLLTLQANPSMACLLKRNTNTSTGINTGKLKMLIML